MINLLSQPEQLDLSISALTGFYNFIGCWCLKGENGFIVIDPGPLATIDELIEYLSDRGCTPSTSSKSDQLFAILLTHIHIDHAGGVGALSEIYSSAKVVAPKRSIKHLIDPTRLKESSSAVLGSLMLHYGDIVPVPEDRLVAAEDEFDGVSYWKAIPTPGHSPDHTSYLIDEYLFCGEALGVTCVPISELYRRPATPPRFEKEPYLRSINELAKLAPRTVCFGHFGSLDCSNDPFGQSKAQIERWISIITENINSTDNETIQILVEKDPLFTPYRDLPEAIKRREDIFIINSIRGIKDYILRS
jgi:glyoxylase-like metal-dependent hydrolase (beta-lactamase superfamily II)